MQTTLLSYLGKKELYPTIFYFDNNLYNITLNNIVPSNSIKLGKIKWNYSKNNLFIYINNTKTIPYLFNTNYTTKNVSLLKSQLQKSIRRQLTDLSLNIAYQFINLDFNEFLRRILIITLEDTLLNKYFPIITWMMVAYSKNEWIPSINDINWLLNYIKYLCSINFRENYNKLHKTHIIPNYNVDLFNNLIFCLELRKAYGGLTSDIKMINWFINELHNRFTNHQYIESINNDIIIENILDNFINNNILLNKPTEMLIEGVDFHNYPQILNEIKKIYYTYDLEDIKISIWEYSSKYNKRCYLHNNKSDEPNDKYYNIWKNIKNTKIKYSKKYLKKNLL